MPRFRLVRLYHSADNARVPSDFTRRMALECGGRKEERERYTSNLDRWCRVKTVHLSTVHTTADSRIMDKEAGAVAEAGWNVAVVMPHDKDEMRGTIKIIGVRKPSSRLVRVTLTAFMVALKGLKERGDVYHFHDPELLPVGLVLRMLGKKVIYDVHETHSASVAHRSH